MISEAKQLHDLGFAILWLYPKSKAPIGNEWQKGKRKPWGELQSSFQKNYNVGVRLGLASQFEDGSYLAVVDCDVKSEDPKHLEEMRTRLHQILPAKAPVVLSGRGNGSAHYYVKTKVPAQGGLIARSSEKTKVHMPSVIPSPMEKEKLTEKELRDGLRVRPAWEISLLGEGQQVVLPPSVHPDSGKAYVWQNQLSTHEQLPLVECEGWKAKNTTRVIEDFKFIEVDLIGSALPNDIVDMILSGKGVESDRSAYLYVAVKAMLRERFSRQAIASVLTDPEYFLGQVGYDHRKTKSRKLAADWILNHNILKAEKEIAADKDFLDEVEISELSPLETAHQFKELITDCDWRQELRRTGKKGDGPPANTLVNLMLVLTYGVSFELFLRDDFAFRDVYGVDTPWGGEKGKLLTDEDAAKIKHWVGDNYRFEPAIGTVFEAMSIISSRNSSHPVRNYLNGLEAWDGVNRLDSWLKQNFGASGPEEYLAQVFRKFLVAAVARVFVPGTKFDWMPIFEGPQGVGKSSLARILANEKWFIDWMPDLSDKDAALGLQGAWIAEMGELATLNRSELEHTKGFITRMTDKVRPPYGKRQIELPRQCVFIGTTNKEQYLKDDSGNRRFNPVRVGQLNFEALERERNQLFAEALFIYRNGLEDTLELTGEAKEYSKTIQAETLIQDESDLIVEALLDFIEQENSKPEKDRFDFTKFKLVTLFGSNSFLGGWKWSTATSMYAGKAIKKLGGGKWKTGGSNYWWLKRGGPGTQGSEVPLPKNPRNPDKLNL